MLIFILLLALQLIAIMGLTFSVMFDYLIGVVICGTIFILNGKYLLRKLKKDRKYLIPFYIFIVLTIGAEFVVIKGGLETQKWSNYSTDVYIVERAMENIDDLRESIDEISIEAELGDSVYSFRMITHDIDMQIIRMKFNWAFKSVDDEDVTQLMRLKLNLYGSSVFFMKNRDLYNLSRRIIDEYSTIIDVFEKYP